MKRIEIEKRIAELEKRIFILAMKDRWDRADYGYNREMNCELAELKGKLKEAE